MSTAAHTRTADEVAVEAYLKARSPKMGHPALAALVKFVIANMPALLEVARAWFASAGAATPSVRGLAYAGPDLADLALVAELDATCEAETRRMQGPIADAGAELILTNAEAYLAGLYRKYGHAAVLRAIRAFTDGRTP